MAFCVQALHEVMFGVSHAEAVRLLGEHPFAAYALYWICGPLFPLSLVAPGVLLARVRAVPGPAAMLLVLGGLAFPLSRIQAPRLRTVSGELWGEGPVRLAAGPGCSAAGCG